MVSLAEWAFKSQKEYRDMPIKNQRWRLGIL